MSVLFSRQCEYALQAVLYLASREDSGYVDIKEMAGKLNIPHHFLAKILQNLSREGLLKSQKGPSGGFALADEPANITLYQIVEIIDGDDFLKECVLGLPACGDNNPCPVHGTWGRLREEIYAMLAGQTIDKIAGQMRLHGNSIDGLAYSSRN